MSDLYRCVQGRENKSINLFSDAPTEGLEGTLNHLLDVHFPGNITWVEEGWENMFYGDFDDVFQVIDCISLGKIQKALDNLGSYKAAGSDGLKLVVLKNLPDSCINRL